jgi:hypothetical protein
LQRRFDLFHGAVHEASRDVDDPAMLPLFDLCGQKIESSLFIGIYALDIAYSLAYLLPFNFPYSTW